jgi:hypothetical protein
MFGLSPPAISHTFSIAFRVNADAAKIYSGDSTPAGNAAQYKVGCFDTLISLALNDYVEMLVRTSYTSTQSSSIGRNGPRLSFRRMRGI